MIGKKIGDTYYYFESNEESDIRSALIDNEIRAEEVTGRKQPSDGYFWPWRDIKDWEGLLKEKFDSGLLQDRDLTENEKEVLDNFAMASSVLSGDGYEFFSSTKVTPDQKELVLRAVKSISLVLAHGAEYSREIDKYYPPTNTNHVSVLTQAIGYMDHLIRTVSESNWDFWRSEYNFDQVKRGLERALGRVGNMQSWSNFGFLNSKQDILDEMENPGIWNKRMRDKELNPVVEDKLVLPDPAKSTAEGMQRR